MIALGVGIFLGFNMEWYSLEKDSSYILDECGFADFRIMSEKGFSGEDADKIRSIEGVDDVSRFLGVNMTVKDDEDILTLSVSENMKISGFIVTAGEQYDAECKDGVWLSDKYAEANHIAIGDEMTFRYKVFEVTGVVKGLVKSGEYLICVPDETQLMPDYTTYGFFYASPEFVRSMLGTEFYSQINVVGKIEKSVFSEKVSDALGETMVIISKDETISYAEAMGESNEGKTMAAVLPVLFLAIAVLTMVTTMHRITASEKTQIGTLKALGFKDRRIIRHYTAFGGFIGLIGTAIGIALGWWVGWFIMNPGGSMGTYLDMPDWTLKTPVFVWFVLVGIVLLLIFLSYMSVHEMLKGTAAEALRPYTPKKMRSLFIERFGWWKKLSFGTKWNLRDSLRHKARSFMTLFGVFGCMLLVVASFGMKDTLDVFIEQFYDSALDYENRIYLDSRNITSDDVDRLALEYDADKGATAGVELNGKSVSLEIYELTHG